MTGKQTERRRQRLVAERDRFEAQRAGLQVELRAALFRTGQHSPDCAEIRQAIEDVTVQFKAAHAALQAHDDAHRPPPPPPEPPILGGAYRIDVTGRVAR